MEQEKTSGTESISKFIGLLYQKYNDPLNFLKTGFETVGIIETIIQIYKDDNDKKLWEMYIHFKPEKKSFEDWKRSISGGFTTYSSTASLGTKNEEETEKIIKDSENILRKFNKSTAKRGET